jgi:hypothetical protein
MTVARACSQVDKLTRIDDMVIFLLNSQWLHPGEVRSVSYLLFF